jgi:hypothetical protein
MSSYEFLINILVKNNNIVAQFGQVNAAINSVDNSVNTLNQNIANKINNISLDAITNQLDRIGKALQSIGSQKGVEFDKSMHELQAITGITGDELDKLGARSRKIGIAPPHPALPKREGVKPLLWRGWGRWGTSGLSIETSATAIAGTINQFGLEASEAERVINVLAAGSKYGAAEIPDLAAALKTVGSAANAAHVSVEQTAAALEVLGQNNVIGAEAGTQLRNVLLRLQTRAGVNFDTTSVSDALDALKPKMNDAVFMTKLFGMGNVAAAQFLVANSDSVAELTDKVTGTSTAMEQATVMQDSMETKLGKINARMDDFKISLFDATGGGIAYMDILGEMFAGVANFIPLLALMGKTFLFVTNAQKMQALWAQISAVKVVVATPPPTPPKLTPPRPSPKGRELSPSFGGVGEVPPWGRDGEGCTSAVDLTIFDKDKKKGNGSKKTDVIDLNDSIANMKGTGAYSTIAAKLNPVHLASLGAKAAATVAIPAMLATGAAAMPGMPVREFDAAKTEYIGDRDSNPMAVRIVDISSSVLAEMPKMVSLPNHPTPSLPQGEGAKNPSSRGGVYIDRFTDQITIHIANADGKGYDQIRGEIENVLMETLDDYDA